MKKLLFAAVAMVGIMMTSCKDNQTSTEPTDVDTIDTVIGGDTATLAVEIAE